MIGNIGPVQLAIVLLIVLLIFGTKRIRSLGSDLGGAIKEFRKGMNEEERTSTDKSASSETKESDDSSAPKH